jgi:putative ABC transport system substrate-binding protein
MKTPTGRGARCGFAFLVLVALGAAPLDGEAQQAGKRPVIVIVSPSRYPEPLARELTRAGFVAGSTVSIDHRWVMPDDKLGEVLADVSQRADVIVAVGTPALIAVYQSTRTIPIVMVAVPTPVEKGFVKNPTHPEANVTGLMAPTKADILTTRLAYLKEMVPGASKIRALAFGAYPNTIPFWNHVDSVARGLRVHVELVEVPRSADLPRIVAGTRAAGADALLVVADALPYESRIVELAAQHRLPAAYAWKPAVDAGGLMSYGPNWDALWTRAAWYVIQLLHGKKPRDLPLEEPATLELVINLKTARALGLTVPRSLLQRADQVIE